MPHNPYRLYLQNLCKHRFYYGVGTFALLMTSITEVMLPKFIQWSIDLLTKKAAIPEFFQESDPHRALDRLVGCLVLILVVGWIGRVGWRQILARQTHIAGHDIKTRIWSVLKDQPLSLLERYPLGDLMNRATADWNKTRFIHGFTLVTVFDLVFFSILAVGSMLAIDWQLALLCLACIPFLPRRIIRISREEYRLHQLAQEQLSLLSDLISQFVSTVRLQRATASEQVWLDRLGKEAEAYAQKQFAVLKKGWQIFIYGALPSLIAYGVLFSLGLLRVQSGELSLGAFIALQSYVLLLQSPLFELGSVISEWQTGFASYQRITEIYDLESPVQSTSRALIASHFDPECPLRIKNLSFNYSGDPKPVLQELKLSVRRGEKIGLIGPIGSGKSTLLHLVAGLLEAPKGHVWLQGLPLEECGRDWITQQVTLLTQKPVLFAGTIRHNLAPGGDCSESEMIDALRSVELWDEVQSFPSSLDSWIGESGINLSGGQKQRLALARALLKPAPLLLIDDGLSAVDAETEARILENLKRRLQKQSMIWSAHRPSTLLHCDRLFRMEQGQLFQVHPPVHTPSPLLQRKATLILEEV